MADLATLQARLSEAETARHQRAIGGTVSDVWKDGRRIRYETMTDREFDAYIANLKRDIAAAEAIEAGRPARSAIGFTYG